ncbi:MAG: hypothetical protein DRJ03_03580 [Chloroflexi bacterium]|nr:MAG: hypothetical protein DRJ03_03580 [Chloroflexota bacterium]
MKLDDIKALAKTKAKEIASTINKDTSEQSKQNVIALGLVQFWQRVLNDVGTTTVAVDVDDNEDTTAEDVSQEEEQEAESQDDAEDVVEQPEQEAPGADVEQPAVESKAKPKPKSKAKGQGRRRRSK